VYDNQSVLLRHSVMLSHWFEICWDKKSSHVKCENRGWCGSGRVPALRLVWLRQGARTHKKFSHVKGWCGSGRVRSPGDFDGIDAPG